MSLIEETPTFVDVSDVGELYGRLAQRLEQIVRVDVRAPDAVIEDACQFAWSRLLHHRHHVRRETVLTWLIHTAVHEAIKLLRRDRRELSVEGDWDAYMIRPDLAPAPFELIERRERLGGICRLPERQQRVLWLHVLGLSYAEIAQREGCTVRTVERQLLRARQRLRQADRAYLDD